MTHARRTATLLLACTALAGAGQPNGSPAVRGSDFVLESIAYAEKLVEKRWPELAIIVYEDVLEHAPKHEQIGDVCFKLGRLNFGRDAFSKSAANFEQFLAMTPRGDRRVDALYWAAESHYAAHGYHDALKAFEQCMKECADARDEKYVHSTYGAGWCYFKLKQYSRAVEHFSCFTDKYFYYELAPEAQLALGRAYVELKRYDDACKAFALVIESGASAEQQAQAYLATGRARFDGERYVEALTALDHVLGKLPESKAVPAAMWWKASILKHWQRDRDASEVFAELAKRHPRSEYGRKAVVELGNHLSHLPPGEIDKQMLREEHMFGLAEAAYREGKLDAAVGRYEALLKSHPQGSRAPAAHFKIGMCLMRGGKLEQAKDRFLAMRAQFPKSELATQAAYRAGHCAYQLGHYPQARELIEKVIAAGASADVAAQARFLLGECLAQAGAYGDAVKRYREALDMADGQELAQEAQFRLAWALYQAKEFEQAAGAFQKFRAKSGESAHAGRALYLEADSLLRGGKQAEAEALLKLYVKQHPKEKSCADALYQLARLAELAGRLDEALGHYWQMRALGGSASNAASDGLAEERICWVLYRKGDEKAALDGFLDVIREWPKRKLHAETYNWIGVSLLRADRHQDAEVVFGRLIEHWGADKSAAALVEQAIFSRAQCHQAMGDGKAQLAALQALMTRFPESRFGPAAKLATADTYAAGGKGEQAASLYREVAHSSTGLLHAEALCKLGLVMAKQREYAKAAMLLRRVVVLFDAPKTRLWALRARVGLGQCCEALGQWDAALKHYQDVVEAKPDTSAIAQLKREAATRLLQCGENKQSGASRKEEQ